MKKKRPVLDLTSRSLDSRQPQRRKFSATDYRKASYIHCTTYTQDNRTGTVQLRNFATVETIHKLVCQLCSCWSHCSVGLE